MNGTAAKPQELSIVLEFFMLLQHEFGGSLSPHVPSTFKLTWCTNLFFVCFFGGEVNVSRVQNLSHVQKTLV